MQKLSLRRAGALALLLTLFTPEAGALSGVSSWAQSDVTAARASGLEPSSFSALSATGAVTRAEFCAVALSAYENVTGWSINDAGKSPFSDCTDPNVISAYQLGLVNGRGDGIFDPSATIQRQDLCVMLGNVLTAAGITAPSIAGEAAVEDFPDLSSVKSYAVNAMITMVDYAIVGGVSDTKAGVTLLQPDQQATRQQALIMARRFCSAFKGKADPEAKPVTKPEVKPETPPEDDTADDPPNTPNTTPSLPGIGVGAWSGVLADIPQDKDGKMDFVYGAGNGKYQTAEEAEPNIIEISVKVWRLQEDGSKTTGTAYIEVNRVLAPLYEKIFEEIYNGDEKFPIKNVGSYEWRTGEHSQGTAIDINYEENMEATINEDGSLTPTCGTHWTPDEDPYSIPEDGDVYNAFAKYGFLWGGNAWRSKRDYMHFSFFGT